MVEIGADGVGGSGGESAGKGEETIGEGEALCGCSGGDSAGLGAGTTTGGGAGFGDGGGSEGVGGDGVGGDGGSGGEVGGGRCTNDVVVVGMDTLSIVTRSATPARAGLFAKVVSVLTAVETSYGLVLATVASTTTEPAVTARVMAADATLSDEARWA